MLYFAQYVIIEVDEDARTRPWLAWITSWCEGERIERVADEKLTEIESADERKLEYGGSALREMKQRSH